jgi:arylsulfatase A-like enzyme
VQRNVLFITVDQWRGDCLSHLGHPLVRTPNIDRLAAEGVTFADHWANAAPCGPSRACMYTGMYMQNHRSVTNGTPLSTRFTNVALEARRAGYRPVLFGYTDTSADPRGLPVGDPRTMTYEGVLPGFDVVVNDPWEQGGTEWGRWLSAHGVDVPSFPLALYEPDMSFPGADEHASTWAPARFPAELSDTAFLTEKVTRWLDENAASPFFVHLSYLRPHPPRRNPVGYHDLYDERDVGPFAGHASPADQAAAHPLNRLLMSLPHTAAPLDERERRQLRATYYGAQAEVDDQLGRLLDHLERTGLAASTLVVLSSDHGEMGGDHWLVDKCGYWDESFHVPLVVRDPYLAEGRRGAVVRVPTESVDLAPTIVDWLGLEPDRQFDGWSLMPLVEGDHVPEHWRSAVHFEWDFRHVHKRWAEERLGIPSAHCSLAVSRSASTKYVQFAADPEVLPPMLFDLEESPGHTHDLLAEGAAGAAERALERAQELLRWRARNLDRALADCFLDPGLGPVWGSDPWR